MPTSSLEATLVIGARDEASAVLARIAAAFDKQLAGFDRIGPAAANAAKAMDPFIASMAASETALADHREGLSTTIREMERLEKGAAGAASAQARLRGELNRTTTAIVNQGEGAARAGGGGHRHGGIAGALGGIAPLEGPEILEKTKQAYEAGATLQEQIARLTASGATPAEIAGARADFLDFSKTHSGVLESEYLGTYKTARVISPGEANEMARLAATYSAAARNSGLSTSEYDVDNVLRSMDELGFKTIAQRQGFLNNMLQVQQTFGSQISTETYLATLRHAKSAMYGWSPEFREQYLPTLIASMGQNGGTAMMTALNNYVGGHMQTKEFEKLISSGFVANSDVYYKNNHAVLKDGAHLFEEGVFKSNIVQWSKDFHDEFMKRRGSTEDAFTRLVTSMPQNMGGLISFILHNQQQLDRDATTIPKALGDRTASDAFLAKNPVAGLQALTASIEQFAAAVTAPGMGTIGAGLQSLAHGIQSISGAYSEFATAHPDLANKASLTTLGAGAGLGGYLSWKLFTGISGLLGFGGGDAAAGAAGAGGGGILAKLGLGALGAGAVDILGGLFALHELGELLNPTTPAGAPYRLDTAWPTQREDMERARRARLVWEGGGWVDDPEAARGRAYHALGGGDGLKVSLDPNSKVQVGVKIEVSPTSAFLQAIAAAQAVAEGSTAVSVGRMNTDASPIPRGALGRR